MKNVQISRILFACPEFSKTHLYIISEVLHSTYGLDKPYHNQRSQIADDCGVSLATVGRAIRELKNLNLINTVYDPKKDNLLEIVINYNELQNFVNDSIAIRQG